MTTEKVSPKPRKAPRSPSQAQPAPTPQPTPEKPRDTPSRVLAIDPGNQHVGVAWFQRYDDGWNCYAVAEETPWEFASSVDLWLQQGGVLDCLVVEQFTLYGDTAMTQVGQEFVVVQLIGILRYLGMRSGVPVHLQPASIQKPTQAALRVNHIKSRSRQHRAGPHAFSAELHGWYYILRTLQEQASPEAMQ